MYYPDLSLYEYTLDDPIEGILNVGWLGKAVAYTQGNVPIAIIEKLTKLLEMNQDVHQMRGTQNCVVCGDDWIHL